VGSGDFGSPGSGRGRLSAGRCWRRSRSGRRRSRAGGLSLPGQARGYGRRGSWRYGASAAADSGPGDRRAVYPENHTHLRRAVARYERNRAAAPDRENPRRQKRHIARGRRARRGWWCRSRRLAREAGLRDPRRSRALGARACENQVKFANQVKFSAGESLAFGVVVKSGLGVVECSVWVREVRERVGPGGEGGREQSGVGLGEHDRGSQAVLGRGLLT
jgi:hypothetical protein